MLFVRGKFNEICMLCHDSFTDSLCRRQCCSYLTPVATVLRALNHPCSRTSRQRGEDLDRSTSRTWCEGATPSLIRWPPAVRCPIWVMSQWPIEITAHSNPAKRQWRQTSIVHRQTLEVTFKHRTGHGMVRVGQVTIYIPASCDPSFVCWRVDVKLCPLNT